MHVTEMMINDGSLTFSFHISHNSVSCKCTAPQKTRQLWNGIAENYIDRFGDIWQKYSKNARIEFATLPVSVFV